MKKIALFTLCAVMALSITACGKDAKKILAFQNEINAVVLKMESLDKELNELDVNAKNAADTALDKLSELNDAFEELANIEVTDSDYSFITGLADEGAEYMAQAYNLFEDAYVAETFDEDTADLAYQYLERATKRIRVIVTMMHGEVPDDVIVH